MFPEQFIERVKLIFGDYESENILDSLSQRKPITLRINTLKVQFNDAIKIIQFLNTPYISIPWYKNAFIFPNTNLKTIQATEIYKNGGFYVQNASSMIPALVLNPSESDKVLDITAAPGSKTTLLANLMNNKGEIVANDTSSIRILRLKANILNQNVNNCRIISKPAQILWRIYPEYFDKVLADVPCSMEGSFSFEKPTSYSNWSLQKIKILSKHQKWILRSAFSCLKPGGLLIYSTCTLAPEENEEIVDWLINKESGSIELVKIDGFEEIKTIPILKWKTKLYNPLIKCTLRINPQYGYEGFFVAKFRKLKSTVNKDLWQ